jgi:hypothetical protein
MFVSQALPIFSYMSKVVVIGGGVIGCAEWSREVASTAGVDVDVRRSGASSPRSTRASWCSGTAPAACVGRIGPVTGDGLSIVEVTGARNLVVATGHHRQGILLARLAAMNVASIVAAG